MPPEEEIQSLNSEVRTLFRTSRKTEAPAAVLGGDGASFKRRGRRSEQVLENCPNSCPKINSIFFFSNAHN
jgi:hypothetical protein